MQQKFPKKQLENSFLVYQDAKTSQVTSLSSEKAKKNITRTSVAFFRGLKNNLHLNADKCEFSKTEIKFYGHIFSSTGPRPNPRKVDLTIHKARPPQNHREVKSLLGMTQYVSRFIPNYATITTPLPCWRGRRRLRNGSKKNKKHWMSRKKPLLKIKCLILIQNKETGIIVDASLFGLGCLSDTKRWSSWLCKSCTEWCWKPLLPNRERNACCSLESGTFSSVCLGCPVFCHHWPEAWGECAAFVIISANG